jgi:hypothetical protein
MTIKILLAKNESRGNLITPDFKQSYYIEFLPRVEENGKVIYCEKGCIALCSPSSNGEEVVKSYRMIDPSQERLLILDLIKLWMFHKKSKDELNEFTMNAFINDLLKQTRQIGQDVRSGLYDGGI